MQTIINPETNCDYRLSPAKICLYCGSSNVEAQVEEFLTSITVVPYICLDCGFVMFFKENKGV